MTDPDLPKLFEDPVFDDRAADPARPWTTTYRRVAHLGARTGSAAPLLAGGPADRQRLRDLLELTAMADPAAFHVLFLHQCMATGAALDFGAAPEDVAALASGRAVGAALMTEVGLGNSSAAVRTEAVYDPVAREFVLTTPDAAAAKYPPNVGMPGLPRLAVVGARLLVAGVDRGTCLFLVPLHDGDGASGVTVAPRPRTSLLPLDYAAVRFDGVRVPYRRWLADGASISGSGAFHDPLGDPRLRTARSVGWARFAWGAVTAGLAAAARAAVAIALPHAGRRATVDRWGVRAAALTRPNQQRLLFGAAARALAATEFARGITDTAWRLAPGGGRGTGLPARTMGELALVKTAVDALADEAVARCRSACGAAGFFSENRLVDYQALTAAFHAAGGDNQLMLLDAAWRMATGDDYTPPPAGPGPAAAAGSEPDWPLLLAARERALYTRLTSGLAAASAGGLDPSAAWHERLGLAEEFAHAHRTRVAVEAVAARWRRPGPSGGSGEQAVLPDLFRLLAVEAVLPHADWYAARGLLSGAAAEALDADLTAVCRRLLPQAESVAGLLEVPAAVVRGPLGGRDYVRDLTS
ncbi:hypothetical protein EF903_14025 [Streptomyces sp. WAC05292]|uniref:hypothetical protein n=1 Tax=Streptomyces sp. WAC05292 TaxID=2487418 RepID=UPI000F73FAEA|nr:hypothetical protein [Streptomyces sp. WAC05292]RSS89443.1 hypothetical protein EF903_14025 [Streptomyces sp. WAC05292]